MALGMLAWTLAPATARDLEMLNGPTDPAFEGDPEGGWRGVVGGGGFIFPPEQPAGETVTRPRDRGWSLLPVVPGCYPDLSVLHAMSITKGLSAEGLASDER
jgi:hypothetical protein